VIVLYGNSGSRLLGTVYRPVTGGGTPVMTLKLLLRSDLRVVEKYIVVVGSKKNDFRADAEIVLRR
jgi:hypothetical protein